MPLTAPDVAAAAIRLARIAGLLPAFYIVEDDADASFVGASDIVAFEAAPHVEIAARAHEPHRIAFYLYDLASDLHALWNRGNDDPALRFVQDGDPATTAAKMALVRSVAVVIAAGLGILGVTPAKEMR